MPIRFSTDELRALSKGAKGADRVAARALRDGLRAAGELVAADARSRASWSSRIPGSIAVKVRAGYAEVSAGGGGAPHAAAYEHEGRTGVFRHPVNAWARHDRGEWVWANNPARPFLGPALESHAVEAADLIGGSVADSLREVIL